MNFNRVEIGDCREVLREIPDGTFHCCVTSPPYWGLRDYGTATWEGGDPACDHSTPRSRGDDIRPGDKQGTSRGSRPHTQWGCDCGARRIDAQLGLEPTPEAYVANMVAVFREVRRCLRDDGVLFLNIGDSYAGSNASAGGAGLKPKDLCMIPARVAMALQADGWYLRSDIIYSKLNPMPESVTDRPTKAHEYVFLMAKSERYYFNADAVREPLSGGAHARRSDNVNPPKQQANVDRNDGMSPTLGGEYTARNIRSVWTIATEPYSGSHFATFPQALVTRCLLAGCPPGGAVLDPFFGSGTVGQVAESLGRRWFGIELNPEYGKLAARRTAQTGLMFGDVEAE